MRLRNTFVWSIVVRWGLFCILTHLFLTLSDRRIFLSQFIFVFFLSFFNSFLPLHKYLFFLLKIFIFCYAISIFLHSLLIGIVIIFHMRFHCFALSFILFFLWTVLDIYIVWVSLLLVLQNFFVMLNQIFKFYLWRIIRIFLYFSMINIFQNHLQLLLYFHCKIISLRHAHRFDACSLILWRLKTTIFNKWKSGSFSLLSFASCLLSSPRLLYFRKFIYLTWGSLIEFLVVEIT